MPNPNNSLSIALLKSGQTIGFFSDKTPQEILNEFDTKPYISFTTPHEKIQFAQNVPPIDVVDMECRILVTEIAQLRTGRIPLIDIASDKQVEAIANPRIIQ